MTDITKCDGNSDKHGKCPCAEHCKRYTSKTSHWQAWMHAPWDGANCTHYLPNSGMQPLDEEQPWEMKI